MLKAIENISADTAVQLCGFFNNGITDAYVLFSLLDWTSVDGAWVQTTGGEITALVVQKEMSKVYVTANAGADFYELADFITGLGGMVVHCPSGITARLGVTAFSKLSLMTLERDVDSNRNSVMITDNLHGVFDLLVQSRQNILKGEIDDKNLKRYSEKAYKEWLAKTERGIKGGYTSVRAVTAGEHSVLSVAVADRLNDFVYIRDVATDRDFRMMGYATDCIAGLCNGLKKENDTVFLVCDDIKTENFYKKTGFERKEYLELGIVEL